MLFYIIVKILRQSSTTSLDVGKFSIVLKLLTFVNHHCLTQIPMWPPVSILLCRFVNFNYSNYIREN